MSTTLNMIGKYDTKTHMFKMLVSFFCPYKSESRNYKLLFHLCQFLHSIIAQNTLHFPFSDFIVSGFLYRYMCYWSPSKLLFRIVFGEPQCLTSHHLIPFLWFTFCFLISLGLKNLVPLWLTWFLLVTTGRVCESRQDGFSCFNPADSLWIKGIF